MNSTNPKAKGLDKQICHNQPAVLLLMVHRCQRDVVIVTVLEIILHDARGYYAGKSSYDTPDRQFLGTLAVDAADMMTITSV